MLCLIDSSAVLNDFSFEFRPENSYATVPAVFEELRDMRSRLMAENALSLGLLSLQEPEKQNLNYVEEFVRSKGFNRLSGPDKALLALALGMKKKGMEFILITDDYSIQNFAKLLEIPFEAAMRGEIKNAIAFSVSCPGCGKAFFPSGKKPWENAEKCTECGSMLQRKKGKIH
jgi:UPF0271 protein